MRHLSIWRTAFMSGLLLLATAVVAHASCGNQKDACKVEGGKYHIAFPAGYDASKNMPAVVALHSWGATGAGLLRSGKMVKKLLARGYVVVAPEGLPSIDSEGNTWDITKRARRDNPAFIVSVADDAAKRFGLNRNKMLLAGFSIGGSAVHNTACRYPTSFKGYAPQSGNFWKSYPESCGAGVNLLHTHGRADTSMPFAGRTIGPGLQQGSLQTAMDIWSKANGCTPQILQTKGKGFTRQVWSGCKSGSLAIDYHPGGHGVPLAWADRVITWFEGL
jgi:polyhydroxybutyrate depolymerase